MRKEETRAITVPLRLTESDIVFLVEELNELESSRLTEFIEDILRLADAVSSRMAGAVAEIRRANPFSQQHKEDC